MFYVTEIEENKISVSIRIYFMNKSETFLFFLRIQMFSLNAKETLPIANFGKRYEISFTIV